MEREITVVQELYQRNHHLVNDLSVLGQALNEKFEQLKAGQSRLDAWFDKTKS